MVANAIHVLGDEHWTQKWSLPDQCQLLVPLWSWPHFWPFSSRIHQTGPCIAYTQPILYIPPTSTREYVLVLGTLIAGHATVTNYRWPWGHFSQLHFCICCSCICIQWWSHLRPPASLELSNPLWLFFGVACEPHITCTIAIQLWDYTHSKHPSKIWLGHLWLQQQPFCIHHPFTQHAVQHHPCLQCLCQWTYLVQGNMLVSNHLIKCTSSSWSNLGVWNHRPCSAQASLCR